MFQSTNPTPVAGTHSNTETTMLHETKSLQRSISNSTARSINDIDDRYGVIPSPRSEETRRQGPLRAILTSSNLGNSGRAGTGAAHAPPAPISSRTTSPSSKNIVIRKKRIITPQMVKRRNINVKNLPLVMKSDNSHTSIGSNARNSVLTENTEKVSNRKDIKRKPKLFLLRNRGLHSIESRDTFDSSLDTRGEVGSRPPLSGRRQAVKEKAQAHKYDENQLGDKENAVGTKTFIMREDLVAISSEGREMKKETRNSEDEVAVETLTKMDGMPLVKRVPSGQSCSAFFLSDEISSTMSEKMKDRTTLKASKPERDGGPDRKKRESTFKILLKDSSFTLDTPVAEYTLQSLSKEASQHEKKSSLSTAVPPSLRITTSRDLSESAKPSSTSLLANKEEIEVELPLSPVVHFEDVITTRSNGGKAVTHVSLNSLNTADQMVSGEIDQRKEALQVDSVAQDPSDINGVEEGMSAADEREIKFIMESEKQPSGPTNRNPSAEKVCEPVEKNQITQTVLQRKELLIDLTNNAQPVEDLKNDSPKTDYAEPTTVGRTKPMSRKEKKKKKQMYLTSFLGKKSKVIDEEKEYSDDCEDVIDRASTKQPVQYEGTQQTDQKKVEGIFRVQKVSDRGSDELDIHLQATLSDCEFSSVQSSVTTDKAFEPQPSIIKRTSSLIRNPLLRRNRSNHTEMEELVQCMKNGKLAAKVDNKKKEDLTVKSPFNELHQENEGTTNVEKHGSNAIADSTAGIVRVDSVITEKGRLSSIGPSDHSSDVQRVRSNKSSVTFAGYAHDFADLQPTLSEKGVSSFVGSNDESSDDYLQSKSAVDENSMKREVRLPYPEQTHILKERSSSYLFDDNVTNRNSELPHVNDSAKMDIRSPSFRLSAVTGSGAPSIPHPLSQKILLNALNEVKLTDSGTYQLTRNASAGVEPVLSAAHSIDHGTQTNIYNAPAEPRGTFGDIIESIGLFSARLCIGTGAAMASCAHSCNDKPLTYPITSLSSSSFIEPEILLPQKKPIVGEALNNNGAYAEVLAKAISQMSEEEQLDLAKQLSDGPHRSASRCTDAEAFDDRASSVDGLFRRSGSKQRKKQIPRNIAVTPKSRNIEAGLNDDQNLDDQVVLNRVNSKGKGPFRNIKTGLKRLTKTRLAVMYQV